MLWVKLIEKFEIIYGNFSALRNLDQEFYLEQNENIDETKVILEVFVKQKKRRNWKLLFWIENIYDVFSV